ncbi:MAG: preprotein translocase subunit SecG [Candidatus Kapabacteria bacterium]|nr:preprotein translocase subunit SecG [Candidatus Kapabacteria bacterium]
MMTFFTIIVLLIAVLLILLVLLQPGKSDMISGMSGLTGQFSTMFGSSHANKLLFRITMGCALTIFALSLMVNIISKGSSSSANIKKAVTEGKAMPIPATSSPSSPKR